MVHKFSANDIARDNSRTPISVDCHPNCCDDDSVCNANYVHNLNEKFKQFYLNKMKNIESELTNYKSTNESYRSQVDAYKIKCDHLSSQCQSYALSTESAGKYSAFKAGFFDFLFDVEKKMKNNLVLNFKN